MKIFAREVRSGVAMMWQLTPPEHGLLYIFRIKLIPSLLPGELQYRQERRAYLSWANKFVIRCLATTMGIFAAL